MLRRVALVRTDVSEEFRGSIIRVTRICELGTTLAVTSKDLTRYVDFKRYLKRGSKCRTAVFSVHSSCRQHSRALVTATSILTFAAATVASYFLFGCSLDISTSKFVVVSNMLRDIPRFLHPLLEDYRKSDHECSLHTSSNSFKPTLPLQYAIFSLCTFLHWLQKFYVYGK
jgi:hypothetical protein